MRSVFAVILKFIAILLAAFTVITTIFILLLMSFNRTILNRQIVRQAFIKNHVYERIPAELSKEFLLAKSFLIDPCTEAGDASSCIIDGSLDGTVSGGWLGMEGAAFINNLNQDQWKNLVVYLIPPADLQASTESTTDEFIAYFRGATNAVTMPLAIVKTRLTEITDEELTMLLLDARPACTVEQQALIMSGEISELGSAPIFCPATGGTSQVLLLDLRRRLTAIAAEVPEQITFIKPPSPSNPPGLQKVIGADLQSTLQKINANSQNLLFLPFALLLLVTVFCVRSLRGLLRWWGIPIFIASLITLILGAVLFFAFDQIWLNYISTDFPPILITGLGDIIYDVTHSLANDLSKQIMFLAGIVTLVALGIILISNRVPPPPDPSLPPLAQPGTPGGPVLNLDRKKKKW